MDIGELNARVEARLITRRTLDGVSVYNYTERCTHSRAWDEYTLQSRGLCIDDATGQVVGRGFDKFFNVGEPECIEPEGRGWATVKMDGVLGISYHHPEHGLRWATRGSPSSEQSKACAKLWLEQHPNVQIPDGVSLLVEIIHKDFPIVVPYDSNRLVVLGMRQHDGGEWLPQEVQDFCDKNGLEVTRTVDEGLEALQHAARNIPASEEGWVIRYRNGRLKVKGDEYHRVSRMVQQATPKRIARKWRDREDLQLSEMPRWCRDRVWLMTRKMDGEAVQVRCRVMEIVGDHRGKPLKSTAMSLKGDPQFSLIMSVLRGKDPDIRKYVAREMYGVK